MKKSLLAALLAFSPAVMRADFMYEETTQLTGGSLLSMLRIAGPLARQAREPNVSTHMINGDRMLTTTKEHGTIVDLAKETITEIDYSKKTYSVMTFAEMQQNLERAMQAMKDRSATGNDTKVNADFKVSAKATGQTKAVQGLDTKELVVTMAIEATDQQSGQAGAMTTVMDTWVGAVPGYDEVKAFQRKMGEKMGYLFGSSMSQMGMMRPEMVKGLEEAGKEMAKLDGVPVQTMLKLGVAGDGHSDPTQAAPNPPSASDAANAAAADAAQSQARRLPGGLGSLAGGLGGFGRRRSQSTPPPQPPPDQQKPATTSAASMLETTTELTSFSSAPVDGSKFEIPAGFKQVQPAMSRPGRAQ